MELSRLNEDELDRLLISEGERYINAIETKVPVEQLAEITEGLKLITLEIGERRKARGLHDWC